MKALRYFIAILLLCVFHCAQTQYRYITFLKDISLSDLPLVGGKNASLGQMINALSSEGIRVPHGFAVTVDGYARYINHNNLLTQITELTNHITDINDLKNLKKVSAEIRARIENGHIPTDLADEITQAYQDLSNQYNEQYCDVAVRSSATAEDLPDASFAGQQDTYLHVQGIENVLTYYKKCIASLFTDRAIAYRKEQGFDQLEVALSVCIQKMIRSDLSCSGVAFSLDTESGFTDVVVINGSYGLGEAIVQGTITPDEYIVHKTTLEQGFAPIIKKQLGRKSIKIIYSDQEDNLIATVPVSQQDQIYYCLTNDEILELSRMVVTIEKHYSQQYKKRNCNWTAMDIEWAKDGIDGKIYIVQARPETVHAGKQKNTLLLYTLNGNRATLAENILVEGISVGQQIASGIARIINSVEEIDHINATDIIITDMTNPDWVPAMKQAAGIITNQGGRTCHAAIVSRELGIPAIVGTQNATEKIVTGQKVTLDCSNGTVGYVYDGLIPFSVAEVHLDNIATPPVPIMVNIADPDSAFKTSFLPTSGIGLVRLEFIITNALKIHPMALIYPEVITDPNITEKIERTTAAYTSNIEFFVEQLACAVGMMAAAFYPRPIIVRFSDFKSNEYYDLIGGSYFEPIEENPMIGFRGASRYYHERYKDAFALECEAMKIVRERMGLTNVKLMIPFVRTLKEAESVITQMRNNGLERGVNGLEVIMMCELPSNVMLIKEFSNYFDGFSIGSNDLTQTTLGIDRDSALISPIFDERDPAVKKMLVKAITTANKIGTYIGICGQAPSDFPELAEFLIKTGINSVSLTPDTVIPFLMRYSK
ncbi:MAG TPA: phosphoenolpyruvate synthase [Candidatus Babeliales bacterium]|nr:phosphoenolpyruvate synthase [Candidatus Babeliales bacterium]